MIGSALNKTILNDSKTYKVSFESKKQKREKKVLYERSNENACEILGIFFKVDSFLNLA